MFSISFFDLLEIVSGKILKTSDVFISGVSIYAEFIRENNIYFCINSSKYDSSDGSLGFTNNEDSVYGFGGNQNGHKEIGKAIEKGATVIIIDDLNYYEDCLNVGFILVEDSLQALMHLAAYHINKKQVKVIAVTGSTGKTTTCQALVDSLSVFMNVQKIHRIRNSVLAMCMEILENQPSQLDCFVVEMQIDGYGQIEQFCSIVKPDIAIITNINFAHYARFKSIEEVLFEKLAVYRNLKSEGFLIINDDNELIHKWSTKQSDSRILKISILKNCQYAISRISTYGEHNFWLLDASVKNEMFSDIKLQTTGIGIVYATLFSLAVADVLRLPLVNFIRDGVGKIKSPIGRFSCFDGINGSQILIDSYNANFISMAQGIEYISKSSKSKKILILGSMLELAEKTESEHRSLGKLINSMNEEFYIITLGEAAMYIVAEVTNISSEKKYCVFAYEDVIDILNTISIDDNTIIFVKGSGAMRMEMIVPYLLAKRIF